MCARYHLPYPDAEAAREHWHALRAPMQHLVLSMCLATVFDMPTSPQQQPPPQRSLPTHCAWASRPSGPGVTCGVCVCQGPVVLPLQRSPHAWQAASPGSSARTGQGRAGRGGPGHLAQRAQVSPLMICMLSMAPPMLDMSPYAPLCRTLALQDASRCFPRTLEHSSMHWTATMMA